MTEQGISITTHTETCCEFPVTSNIMHLYTREEREDSCINCYETKESKSDKHAWDLHEDDRLGEGQALTLNQDDTPTASDWVSSETIDRESRYIITLETIKIDKGTYIDSEGKTRDYNENWYHMEERVVITKREGNWLIRSEFTKPVVMLQDGGEYEELWELDDMRQRSREVVCTWCHILTPKAFNQCQDCDGILEHNVR